jgi:D-aspartate ligase
MHGYHRRALARAWTVRHGPGRAGSPPAIILGGAANAVSVARSLGRAGVAVHALGAPGCPVRWSRHCRSFTTIAGEQAQQEALEWLARGPRAGVVLPCDDDGLELIARHRSDIAGLGYLPIEADDEVLLAMLDKQRTYTLASELGIATPFTFVPRSLDELESRIDELSFPCALKPVHSHVFARHFPRTKALRANDADDLRRKYTDVQALGIELLVTETIPGPEDAFCSYYSYLDERGESLLEFSRHKLRQFPIGFGSACYATNEPNPEAAELGLRFFRGVGLRGIGNVEFKRDARDGALKLIECNPRFTAAERQLQLCGLDLPLFAYNRVLGRPLPPMETRRSGVRLWHPLQDTRAFMALRRDGQLTTTAWVRSLAHRQHFPVASAADPLPTLGYHAHTAISALRTRRGPGPVNGPTPTVTNAIHRTTLRVAGTDNGGAST